MSDTTIRFRKVYEDEMKEFETSEWNLAKQEIDLYFVPKLMEYEHIKKWYIPNILQWHTPNVMDGGIMLSVSVREEEIYSNDDAGWVSRPSDSIEFVLGKDSFIGMMGVFSRVSVDRNSEKLYHLHIDPEKPELILSAVDDNEQLEFLRKLLIDNDIHGVAFKCKIEGDGIGSKLTLKRFGRNPMVIHIGEHVNEIADLGSPEAIEKIKDSLGLKEQK